MQQFVPGMVAEKETLPMPPQKGQTLEGFVKFHYLFWSFTLCIDGFQYCKPVVQVDGTCLYDKYKRTLFVVGAQDDNNKILPIAFVIVEGETAEAWLFFLKNLKRHVTYKIVYVWFQMCMSQ